jgi:hypothetical protein
VSAKLAAEFMRKWMRTELLMARSVNNVDSMKLYCIEPTPLPW